MYVNLKHINILIALLKKHNIRHLVLSPGSRNIPFVHSVEKDGFFTCYSIVDERSAAFFAIGLIQELGTPVAICCTSGTAVCNYSSGVAEAYYQKLPLIVLTADRNPYYLNQMEDQMIPQIDIFKNICKSEVFMPIVKNTDDEWYCTRIVNEALLEMNHHGSGPIHIDFPVPDGHFEYEVNNLPEVKMIERFTVDQTDQLRDKLKQIRNKRILLIYGQTGKHTETEINQIRSFCTKYDAVITADLLSNLQMDECVYPFVITKVLNAEAMKVLKPDIIVSCNGNTISGMRSFANSLPTDVEHWLVCEDGRVADPFKKLNCIFEMSTKHFFQNAIEASNDDNCTNGYASLWKHYENTIQYPVEEFNDWYVVKRFMQRLPEKGLLHLANSSSVRLAQYFRVPTGIRVYCNRGTNGIDGSMSSFIGQSCVTNDLSFLLIGDLSFFYDMNALWNRYVRKNVRILLNNNSGAHMFHYTHGVTRIDTLNENIAAEHFTTAEGWAKECAFIYLKAKNEDELEAGLQLFMSESDRPILLEVFTDKKKDADYLKMIEHMNEKRDLNKAFSTIKQSVKRGLKKVIK